MKEEEFTAKEYACVTDDEFQTALEALVSQESAENLLSIPGVYEVLAEHFNNEALDLALRSR